MHCLAMTTKLLSNYAQAQPTPSETSTQLLDLLITYKPDWTSRRHTGLPCGTLFSCNSSPKHTTHIHISTKLVPSILLTSTNYPFSCERTYLMLICRTISTRSGIPFIYKRLSVGHKTPSNISRASRPINCNHGKAERCNQGYQVNTGKVRYSQEKQTLHHTSNLEQYSPAVAERGSIPGSHHVMGSSHPLLFRLPTFRGDNSAIGCSLWPKLPPHVSRHKRRSSNRPVTAASTPKDL